MWTPNHAPMLSARRPWHEALSLPGAGQMRHGRALMLSRPYLRRIPDQTLIVSDAGAGAHHVRATRDSEGTYAMVYVPSGRPVELNLTLLTGELLSGYWYDPRTGVARAIGAIQKQERAAFTPPSGGPDWVLVIDDAASGYHAPGAAA
jgi:hypothetical protein